MLPAIFFKLFVIDQQNIHQENELYPARLLHKVQGDDMCDATGDAMKCISRLQQKQQPLNK